ncbi:Uncharacterised protein [Vibrio cholerae]|nr:Uncharacterised protein [Vibrio cholerae]
MDVCSGAVHCVCGGELTSRSRADDAPCWFRARFRTGIADWPDASAVRLLLYSELPIGYRHRQLR